MPFDKLVTLKLKGANFTKETELKLFEKEENGNTKIVPNSIVYGKNGSGKSTISRAFKYISDGIESDIQYAKIYDSEDREIIIDDAAKKRIHVFNEDYIKSKVDLPSSEDGLKTIVVLGEKVDVESKLKEAEKELTVLKNNKDDLQTKVDNRKDRNNIESPDYYLNLMTVTLKKDDECWARRDADIENKSNKSVVRDDKYKEFIFRSPAKTRDELLIDFHEKMKELRATRTGEKIIEPSIRTSGYINFDVEKYKKLLAKKIEKPILSERDKYILTIKKELGEEHIKNIPKMLSGKNQCPVCFQMLSEEYEEKLFQSIERILSKEAEEHSRELHSMVIEKVAFDFELYSKLDLRLLEDSQMKLTELNNVIDKCAIKIKQKIDDTYTPIDDSECEFSSRYQEWLDSIGRLENARNEYNEKIKDTSLIEKELKDINADITYYDIQEAYASFQTKNDELKKLEIDLESADEVYKHKLATVNELLDKKKSITIARAEINDGLKYIFFADGRLSIDCDETKEIYLLKSRGHDVQPKNVSVGERNAIALCYFFSEIMENQKRDEAVNGQYLIVIDDPVSSFDMDNRIGILSYLKSQIFRFANGNKQTHFLIMSHDLQTTYDLNNVLAGLSKTTKELENQELIPCDMEHRNEYSMLLGRIYDFAKNGSQNESLYIGNAMRRVVEAYSTFVYKGKMVDLPQAAKEELADNYQYFNNFMYRLILNGESHSETRMQVMLNDDFLEYVKLEEKQHTAKALLCMLYLINKKHVIKHIKGKGLSERDIIQTINGWLSELSNDTLG